MAAAVLALQGNPPVAETVVHALLDPDPRFVLDGAGAWRLADPGVPFSVPLRFLDFAVVDVETTGSLRWRGHGMIEIAVVQVSGGVIGETWHTLLDPGRRIPPFVTELTGITPDMVRGAPDFEHVAAEVYARLEGRVFVAHNVGFDWGFVESHLTRTLGETPRVQRLCTLQLSRRLLPRRSRSLDAVAHHFGIEIHGRHRALGDAIATARIFLRLLDAAELRGFTDLEGLRRLSGTPRSQGVPRPSAGAFGVPLHPHRTGEVDPGRGAPSRAVQS